MFTFLVQYDTDSATGNVITKTIKYDNVTNGVPCDTVDRLYHGILYIKNDIRLYSIHIM